MSPSSPCPPPCLPSPLSFPPGFNSASSRCFCEGRRVVGSLLRFSGLEGLDGCGMQTAQVPNTFPGPTKGASSPFPPAPGKALQGLPAQGSGSSTPFPPGFAGSLLLSPVLQGGLLQAGACQPLPFQPSPTDFGDSAWSWCSPTPVPCAGICPTLLRVPLGSGAPGAPPVWGVRQTRLCFALMVMFLPHVLPVHRSRYPLPECNYPSSSPSPSSGWLLPSSEFCIVPLVLATKANNNKIC